MINLRTFELSAGPKSAKIVSVPANADIDSIKEKVFKILQIKPDQNSITFHTTKSKRIDTTALPTNESISSIGLQDNSILILRKKPDLVLRPEAEFPTEVKGPTTSNTLSHSPVAISLKSISIVNAGRTNLPALSVPQPLRPLRATEEQPPTPVPTPVPSPAEAVPVPNAPSNPPNSSLLFQNASPVAHTPPASAIKKPVPVRAPLPPSPTSASRHKQLSSLLGTEKVADTPQISELKQKIRSLQMEKEELQEKLHASCEASSRLSAKCDAFSQCHEGYNARCASLFSLVRRVNTVQATFKYQNASFVEKTHEYLLTVFFSKVEQSDLNVSMLLQRYGSSMGMLYNALSFQFKLTRTPKYAAVCLFLGENIPELLCAVPVICHLYYNREPEFLEELFFTLRGAYPTASTWVHLCLPHGKQLYYSVVCRFAQPLCPAVVETTPCVRVDVAGDTCTCPRLGLSNRCAEDQISTAGQVLQNEVLGAMLTGRKTASVLFNALQDQHMRADNYVKDSLL